MPQRHGVREVHVVCNTHWDREFRETFEITRRGLLDMMDITLDLLDSDPRYASFTLDAHAILVEDYLEMRPQRRPQIERLLRQRRLFIGPWYTLPDAMNVGAEALVRNFLRARTVAESLHARCLRVGYSPNNWGQPSQMPQIFRGFGVDSALIYRGISPHECPSEFIWAGADGTEILGHRFARLARYNWYYLVFRPVTRGVEPTDKHTRLDDSIEKPFRVVDGRSRATTNFRLLEPAVRWDRQRVVSSLEAMLELEGADSSTGLFLAMHGHDMSVAHPKDADVVEATRDALAGKVDVRMSNLEDFVERLRESLDRSQAIRLTGERRTNLKEGFWTYLLPCTISARTYLKVINTEAENALVGEAEPLSCLARALGGDYLSRYLDRAWRFLLENHTHDANAGCAPDRVCQDLEYRYRQSLDIATICGEDAMKHVARNVAAEGRDGDVKLIAFNPHPQPRDEVVELDVALPQSPAAAALEIVDDEGQACDVQVVDRRDDSLFVDNIWDVPTYADVTRFRLQARFRDLPALGYRTYAVRSTTRKPKEENSLVAGVNVLENEHVRVEVQPDGTVNLLHRPTGRRYRSLNSYRDQGEAGNAWCHEPPTHDEVIDSRGGRAQIDLIEGGSLSATIRARVTLELPEAGPDGVRRSESRVPFRIATDYTVRQGDPRLHVRVEFDNCVRDHWLRAVFPTRIRTDVVHADTHFDVVERAIAHPDDTGWIEPFRGTAPMHSMLDLSDGVAGLAILTAGLFEYEVFDDDKRTVALSLVRSFPIKLQVSEEKMQVLPDTGVQCPGRQTFRYAILPHAGNYVEGRALVWAQRFNNPPRVVQTTPRDGRLPSTFSLIHLEGTGLVPTAVKKAERSDDLLLRLFNCDTRDRDGVISFGVRVSSVRAARLDETPTESVPVIDDCVRLSIPPKKIVTLLVTLAQRESAESKPLHIGSANGESDQ
jgi:mannosylglycerate hydrolase